MSVKSVLINEAFSSLLSSSSSSSSSCISSSFQTSPDIYLGVLYGIAATYDATQTRIIIQHITLTPKIPEELGGMTYRDTYTYTTHTHTEARKAKKKQKKEKESCILCI